MFQQGRFAYKSRAPVFQDNHCIELHATELRGILEKQNLDQELVAWENWTGPSAEFYRSLGFTYKQMTGIIGKAKKLKREGRFGSSEFKQVKIDAPIDGTLSGSDGPCAAVEIVWTKGQVIRFSGVDFLLDFLKKSAVSLLIAGRKFTLLKSLWICGPVTIACFSVSKTF